MSEESRLPLEDVEITKRKLNDLLYTNHMDLANDPPPPEAFVVNTALIQVIDGKFSARMIGQNDKRETLFRFVGDSFQLGVPHGFGEAVERVNAEVVDEPNIKGRFIKDPRLELLKLLREEVSLHGENVQPPFTILLLRNDGTVSDFSDNQLCRGNPNAATSRVPHP